MWKTKALYCLIFLGIVISAYLTVAKTDGGVLYCPDVGIINCASVINSQYSTIGGVPDSLFGLALFLLAPVMILRAEDTLNFLWSLGGAASVVYSVSSMFLLGEICIWCLTLDLVIICSLVVVNWKAELRTLKEVDDAIMSHEGKKKGG